MVQVSFIHLACIKRLNKKDLGPTTLVMVAKNHLGLLQNVAAHTESPTANALGGLLPSSRLLRVVSWSIWQRPTKSGRKQSKCVLIWRLNKSSAGLTPVLAWGVECCCRRKHARRAPSRPEQSSAGLTWTSAQNVRLSHYLMDGRELLSHGGCHS